MTGDRSRTTYQAIVVGGGPAGSTTARLLAEAGCRVLLLDKAAFPRHKACSDYLNPAAVRVLRELGAMDALWAAHPHPMQAMRVHAPGDRMFEATFRDVEPGHVALGITRHRLDDGLLQQAVAAGVEVRERAHVRDLVLDRGRVVGVQVTSGGVRETIRAPITIGADGHHSVVSRRLELDVPVRWPRRTGLAAHFRGLDRLGDWGELHVTSGGYAGLALLEDGLATVTLVTNVDAVAQRAGSVESYYDEKLAEIPIVREMVARSERVGPIRGVGPLARRVRRRTGDGYLLVGDAAGFLDPFTGEGIYKSLQGARLAAPVIVAALERGDTSARALAPYTRAYRRAFFANTQVLRIVQAFVHSPSLMSYVIDRLEQRAELGRLLTGVVSDLRPAQQALSPLFLARLLRP
ncbi:MAG: NAD(P)/FAD-dependent oxidoreductase [Chloroflexota bacterium]|nr:NAD(P)/FAD-dependent oxidoreductase [Chloroflexota bacterium]